MSIANTGNGWEYGTIGERLNETAYPDLRHLPGYDEFARSPRAHPEKAPYPAFVAQGGHEVHLQPRQDHLIVWLTEADSSKILVETRVDSGVMLTEDGPGVLELQLESALRGHDLDVEVPADVQKKAAEAFADPFDPDLRRALRRPTGRVFSRRLRHVEAEADPQYGRTMWTATLATEPNSPYEEFEESYSTEELLGRFPGTFPMDYERQTRETIYMRNGTWHIWFDVSLEWIRQAAVRSHEEDALPDVNPGVIRWRESNSGVFHLYNTEIGESACGHGLDEHGRTHDFELGVRPPSTSICAHCSTELKGLHLAERLDSFSWA